MAVPQGIILDIDHPQGNRSQNPDSSETESETWVVLRKRAPKCDIELFALDLLVLVANRLVQCATYTV